MNRREFVAAGGVSVLGASLGPSGALAADLCPGLKNEGAGMYTDPSVANQDSSFTINPVMVSCGVGTGGPDRGSTAFAMLMYATKVRSYNVDEQASTIKATGRMRSTTLQTGQIIEDVLHRFIAIAVDAGDSDRFDIHFKTPFWNTGNPLCTPSDKVDGGCRFGGKLILGDVAVGCGGLPPGS